MNYEDMFPTLVIFLFTFNLISSFYVTYLPQSMSGMGAQYQGLTYGLSDATTDKNQVLTQDFNSGTSVFSTAPSGSSFFGLVQFSNAFSAFGKFLDFAFLGYYNLGIFIAELVEGSTAGALHFILGGIGFIISILIDFGMLLLLRNIIFRV